MSLGKCVGKETQKNWGSMTYCHEVTERDVHKKHEQNTEFYQNPSFLKNKYVDFLSHSSQSFSRFFLSFTQF